MVFNVSRKVLILGGCFLFGLFQICQATTIVEFELQSYTNSKGITKNKKCCNSSSSVGSNGKCGSISCFYEMSICIGDPKVLDNGDFQCTGETATTFFNDTNGSTDFSEESDSNHILNLSISDPWITGEGIGIYIQDISGPTSHIGVDYFIAHFDNSAPASSKSTATSKDGTLNGTWIHTLLSFKVKLFCDTGYTGQRCDTVPDQSCLRKPCKNGGTCHPVQDIDFVCSCPIAYTGRYCEKPFKPCDSNPCQHGGACADIADSYGCTCSEHTNGFNCEHVEDLCQLSPCFNNGDCIQNGTNFRCECNPPWQGKDCRVRLQCSYDPCHNGAVCTDVDLQNYKCVCTSGWAGSNCSKVDSCLQNPCSSGGTCFLDNSNEGFNCHCLPGWIGPYCDEHVPSSTITPSKTTVLPTTTLLIHETTSTLPKTTMITKLSTTTAPTISTTTSQTSTTTITTPTTTSTSTITTTSTTTTTLSPTTKTATMKTITKEVKTTKATPPHNPLIQTTTQKQPERLHTQTSPNIRTIAPVSSQSTPGEGSKERNTETNKAFPVASVAGAASGGLALVIVVAAIVGYSRRQKYHRPEVEKEDEQVRFQNDLYESHHSVDTSI